MCKLFRFFFFLFLLVNGYNSYAQIFSTQWQKIMGGTSNEAGAYISIIPGGYIMVGDAGSIDYDVVGNHSSSSDVWVIKLDVSGNVIWKKCYGGLNGDNGVEIHTTPDGGYIFGGRTFSNDGDVSGNHSSSGSSTDSWIVKLDSIGNIVWQKCLGGTDFDNLSSLIPTTDGGSIFISSTDLVNGDIVGSLHGLSDVWVVKLNSVGAIQWQKLLGGSNNEGGNLIKQTSDGGYILCLKTSSNDGDVTGAKGGTDGWVVKLNNSGNIVWQKVVGGTNTDDINNVVEKTTGGYVLVGSTKSNDGDVSGNHGGSDAWLVMLDANGNLVSQKCFGGTSDDGISEIVPTANGYIMSGNTTSNNGDVSGNNGYNDVWILNIDPTGNLISQSCIGGILPDYAFSLQLANDGTPIFCGSTYSKTGSFSGNHGLADLWIAKLQPFGVAVSSPKEIHIDVYPNPSASEVSFSIIGNTESISLLTLIDNLGRVVYTQDISYQTLVSISHSHLTRGIYSYQIQDKNKHILSSGRIIFQ